MSGKYTGATGGALIEPLRRSPRPGNSRSSGHRWQRFATMPP